MLHTLAGYLLTLPCRLAALSESDVEQLDLRVRVSGCGRQICVRQCFRFPRSFCSTHPAMGALVARTNQGRFCADLELSEFRSF